MCPRGWDQLLWHSFARRRALIVSPEVFTSPGGSHAENPDRDERSTVSYGGRRDSPYAYEPCDFEYDITSLAAYVDGRAGGKGTAPIRALVYALRPGVGYSSAIPTTLIAASVQKTVSAGQAPGWVTLPLSQPLEVRTFENYWFGIQVGGSTKIVRIYGNNDGSSTYDSGTGDYAPASAYNSDAFSDGPSKFFGAFHSGTLGTMVSGTGGT